MALVTADELGDPDHTEAAAVRTGLLGGEYLQQIDVPAQPAAASVGDRTARIGYARRRGYGGDERALTVGCGD
ncbi:hypothetical protein OHA59_48865 [Streptomyces sp. NBC_01589]|uniref:hypothetical protein n=1 Tax=Streptomyces sp. NBC_01589 TaxID=2975886 RepID=UPI0038675CF1